MLQKRGPITTVMKVLGWTDISTMDVYTRLAGVEIDGATIDIKVLPKNSPPRKDGENQGCSLENVVEDCKDT